MLHVYQNGKESFFFGVWQRRAMKITNDWKDSRTAIVGPQPFRSRATSISCVSHSKSTHCTLVPGCRNRKVSVPVLRKRNRFCFFFGQFRSHKFSAPGVFPSDGIIIHTGFQEFHRHAVSTEAICDSSSSAVTLRGVRVNDKCVYFIGDTHTQAGDFRRFSKS